MRRNTKKPFVKREEADPHKINEKITAREIRLLVEGAEPIIISTFFFPTTPFNPFFKTKL